MITDEMIKKSKESSGIKGFYIIDDNYILIRDTFDENWIERTKRLRERGVNYCGPIECRVVDNQSYALEHRAQGQEWYITKEVNGKGNYLQAFGEYMSKLMALYEAPQEQFDKFFDDIDKMAEEGMKPDVCSYGNLFYDPNIGFSFIDVYPNPDGRRLDIGSIFSILLNSKFSVSGISLLPEEYGKEYNLIMREVYRKITKGMLEFGYPEQEIKAYVEKAIHTFSESECVPQGESQKEFDKRSKEREGFIFI